MGSRHFKITPEILEEIQFCIKSGYTKSRLCQRFGINTGQLDLLKKKFNLGNIRRESRGGMYNIYYELQGRKK